MLKKEDVYKIIDKLKYKTQMAINGNNYEEALELIYSCANIIYQTNLYYVDNELESFLCSISEEFKLEFSKEDTCDSILFYDGFGLNDRGLAQIYLNALCKIKKVVYVTYEDRKDDIPDILLLLKKYKGTALFVKRNSNKFEEQINDFLNIVNHKKPKYFFFYSFPNDVVGVVISNVLKYTVKRYQINLTDHAFWLGPKSIDFCIEFRDYGATISNKYRGIEKERIVKLPFYPNIKTDNSFHGFPFKIESKNKVIFSGGSLYKTFGGDNKYYKIVDHILFQYKEVLFWYAGSGDDTELKKIAQKYPNRVFITPERNDLFCVLQNCRLFLNTYPICGGLMYQYAALAGTVPVTLKYDDDADGYLLNQERLNVTFEKEEELFREIDKLLNDDSYYEKRKKQMCCSVIKEDEFLNNIQSILRNKNTMKINYLDIDTTKFRNEYLERIKPIDIDIALISKHTFKSIIKFFPMQSLRGVFGKIFLNN